MQKETVLNNLNYLYIVSTPIGNLKDITLRALDILSSVDIIACEDTRITKKLLSHYKIINKQLVSYGKHNLKNATNKLIKELKINKKNIALVSDSGTPLISDPGTELIQECYKNNIKVTTIPGASSVISALTLSGANFRDFYFGGFLENKNGDIQQQLLKIKNLNSIAIFFTTSIKLSRVIDNIITILGANQKIIITRELTKLFEEIIIEEAIALKQRLTKTKLLGEIVLLLPISNSCVKPTTDEINTVLTNFLQHTTLKNALLFTIEHFKKLGISLVKKDLYKQALEIKNAKNTVK